MSATRKDFVAIAESVRITLTLAQDDGERALVVRLARFLARDLASMNSNFQRMKFLTACGLTEDESWA